MSHQQLGQKGELIGVSYLKEQGFKVIETNYRSFLKGEIDIIALEGQTLCFVEVKTRANKKYGTPQEAVTAQKQKKIARLAQAFINEKQLVSSSVRFDVLAIDMSHRENGEIEYFKNAFECTP